MISLTTMDLEILVTCISNKVLCFIMEMMYKASQQVSVEVHRYTEYLDLQFLGHQFY